MNPSKSVIEMQAKNLAASTQQKADVQMYQDYSFLKRRQVDKHFSKAMPVKSKKKMKKKM